MEARIGPEPPVLRPAPYAELEPSRPACLAAPPPSRWHPRLQRSPTRRAGLWKSRRSSRARRRPRPRDDDQRCGGEPPRTSAHNLTPTCLTTGSPLLDVHPLRCSGGVLVQTLLQCARRGEFRRLARRDVDRLPRRGIAPLPGRTVADAELPKPARATSPPPASSSEIRSIAASSASRACVPARPVRCATPSASSFFVMAVPSRVSLLRLRLTVGKDVRAP